jgi:hypothetical protein
MCGVVALPLCSASPRCSSPWPTGPPRHPPASPLPVPAVADLQDRMVSLTSGWRSSKTGADRSGWVLQPKEAHEPPPGSWQPTFPDRRLTRSPHPHRRWRTGGRHGVAHSGCRSAGRSSLWLRRARLCRSIRGCAWARRTRRCRWVRPAPEGAWPEGRGTRARPWSCPRTRPVRPGAEGLTPPPALDHAAQVKDQASCRHCRPAGL